MAIFGKKSKERGQDYISAAESRKISRENRRITDRIEKQELNAINSDSFVTVFMTILLMFGTKVQIYWKCL